MFESLLEELLEFHSTHYKTTLPTEIRLHIVGITNYLSFPENTLQELALIPVVWWSSSEQEETSRIPELSLYNHLKTIIPHRMISILV
jgi:hypothetical protein